MIKNIRPTSKVLHQNFLRSDGVDFRTKSDGWRENQRKLYFQVDFIIIIIMIMIVIIITIIISAGY